MCFKETSNITERYTLIEEPKTWTEAQQYCREHHTDLVSIKSASENEDLVKKAQGKAFWIGLFNNAWKWSRQSYNYTFHNWDNEEPNNVGGSEGCVVMDYSGTWKDISCSSKLPFICCYATGSFLIYNTDHNKCVDAISSSSVVASPCNPDAKSQQFRWVSEYRLQSVSLELCLGVASKTDWVRILLYPCDEKNELQQWECREDHLFAIQGANLFFNYGNTNDGKVILYHGSGPWSRWSIYGTDVGLCSRLSRSHEDGLCSFEETEKTWHDAQSYCRNQSKELVTIQYQARVNETLDLLNSTGSSDVWIGLYHDKKNWQWSKGDAFIYYNWRSVQFCASVNSEGEWEDRACSEMTRFMCYSETSNITARYTLIEELKTWTEAQQYCREHHTDLVSIKSASENEDLAKKVQGKTFWIGLFNDPWKWSHQGDNYTFHNWANEQPNNMGGNEKCVIIGVRDGASQSRGEWHDKDCSLKLPFFCFDVLNATSPPSTLTSEDSGPSSPPSTPVSQDTTPSDPPSAPASKDNMAIRRVKLTAPKGMNLEDPKVSEAILEQIQEHFSKKFPMDGVKMRWRKQDGEIFHKDVEEEDEEEEEKEEKCSDP
ncbi:macrophage mannose receptor 1-like [Acipenser ruthenus]|uniref:macrophage mannose receptor 1-like n=1 Tax=Acipenser ruthenus TaxID=7906 RepID=UPI002742333B|nr:macrophage mannose receptor 1-like [Acipenser ruthenus]